MARRGAMAECARALGGEGLGNPQGPRQHRMGVQGRRVCIPDLCRTAQARLVDTQAAQEPGRYVKRPGGA